MGKINFVQFCVFCIFIIATSNPTQAKETKSGLETIKVFTVATEENDGYGRYVRSAKINKFEVVPLGLGLEWKGGDMSGPGGGFKINLLKEAVAPFKDDNNTIILFTDSYDVIFTSTLTEIHKKFKEFDAKIVFGAEKFCWPDKSLAKDYPTVAPKASRYLNSGMFMGYGRNVYELINRPVEDTDDDQLFYTKLYLDSDIRKHLGIKLDIESKIFQNLNGAKDDVKLDVNVKTGSGVLQNINFLTNPSVVHGNGPSKLQLNAFGNYLAGTFNEKCVICEEERQELDEIKLPVVTLAIFAQKPVPFFEEFLGKVANLYYPKEKINLLIYSGVEFHDDLSKSFHNAHEKEYLSAKLIVSTDDIDEKQARKLAVNQAIQKESDYLFAVDAEVHLDDPGLLKHLMTYKRNFISPVITRDNELWSNFWGALSDDGYYARSHDYVDIVKGNIVGMWNVPYVSSCYLVKKDIFKKLNFDHKTLDADMAMCENLRDEGVFMYIINDRDYAHLVNSDNFDITVARPDFYTLLTNQKDWEQRYIHPEYYEQLKPNVTYLQPCPDVYWLRIGTERFCQDMVAIMENYGKWSDGTNTDKRLEGGYEAVPTRDIHMKQVGLDALWLKFLQLFVRPLQENIFIGYFHNPPKSLMNFVVRYRPDEQPSLRPHHDSSTYTINIALNRAGIDYQGGGCNFLRYNCSITATKMGWMLMHPGRLTHYHEGLKVTNGTRYIMISFVDP